MNQKQKQERIDRLMPNGIPRYLRIYDKPEMGDRFTVVFTGNYKKHFNGECNYRAINAFPFHPAFGFSQWDSHTTMIDRPTYSHLGKKIKFEDLPSDTKKVIINDYKDLWELN